MSRKFAVVVIANSKYIPGVNAILNALKYYGSCADFHLLFDVDDEMDIYIDSIKRSQLFPNFVSIDFQRFIDSVVAERGYEPRPRTFYYNNFRHLYAATLVNYDSVVILDADMAVTNNFDLWFEVSASTGLKMQPRYNFHFRDNPDTKFVSTPSFVVPKDYGDIAGAIVDRSYRDGKGDQFAYNRIAGENSFINKMLLLPDSIWRLETWTLHRLWWREYEGRRYLATRDNEPVNIIHGRWWLFYRTRTCLREPRTTFDIGINRTVRNLWEAYYYFNTQCFHKIDWDEQMYGSPERFAEIDSDLYSEYLTCTTASAVA